MGRFVPNPEIDWRGEYRRSILDHAGAIDRTGEGEKNAFDPKVFVRVNGGQSSEG